MAFWQQKPLPPGWEAKYDQRSGKYFFVNHTTKQTQWVDPRPAFYASQPQAAAAPAPAMAQHRRPPEQIAMQHIPKHKCKTCHVTEVPVAGNECRLCQVKKAQAQQREAALVRAREERDAAEKKRQNEERIKQEQEKRRAQSAKRQVQQSGVHETQFGAGGEEEEEEEAAPVLSQAQKQQLVRELAASYTDVSDTVVDMVLESCQYKKTMAIGVLNSMSSQKVTTREDQKIITKGSTPRGGSKPATSSPQKAKELTATQKQRVKDNLKKVFPQASETMITLALETTNYDQKKAEGVLRMLKDDNSKSPAKKTSTAAKSKTSKATTSKTSTSKASTSKASTSKASTSKTTGPAKTVTVKEKKKPKTVQAARAKTPERTEYNSSHSTAAKGRDSSLAKGPNADLLIDNYVHEGGADVSMRHGPNPANVGGPSYESTKSSSLATGPQASMRNGPQSSLAKGSLYQGDRQN